MRKWLILGVLGLLLAVTLPNSLAAPAQQEFSFEDSIDDATPFVSYSLELAAGDVVLASLVSTSGDLDPYLALVDDAGVYAENDDFNDTTRDSLLVYQVEADGEYTLLATRYNFEEGETSGDFLLEVLVGDEELFDWYYALTEAESGFETTAEFDTDTGIQPADFSIVPGGGSGEVAEWTILAYIAGDNNLELSSLIDINEFEIAGGSTDEVRAVVFLDRSPEYDASNGDWATARVYEVGGDSGEVAPDSPEGLPLIDTVELADLGFVDSGIGETLAGFLIWGIENYPAENYVVVVNDHGGGWTGLAGDDTTGNYIQISDFAQAFELATQVAGVDRMALLINDACLMSSVEYLDAVSPYFDYALGASEIMYGPGYNMTVLSAALQEGFSIEDIGQGLIEVYQEEVVQAQGHTDQTPTFIALQNFPAVSAALEEFAALVNSDPRYYAYTLGEARYNTYSYAQGTHLEFLIDLGDFMFQVQTLAEDAELYDAAQNVLDAIDSVMVYSQRGASVPQTASLININFPETADEFIGNYPDEVTTLPNWLDFLSNYYDSFGRGERRSRGVPDDQSKVMAGAARQAAPTPTAQQADAPQVSITNVYPAPPQTASVTSQAIVSMEVVGADIVRGTFTVDLMQEDGTLRRVDTSDILTPTELEDGTIDYINDWDSGVNDFDFIWDPYLTTVSDGTNTYIELVTNRDNRNFINGRFRANPEANWDEVTVYFNDEGTATQAIAAGQGSQSALGPIRLIAGGEFQAYNAIVNSDGRQVFEPGNIYTLTEAGLSIGFVPATSGDYQLGFLMETLSGATGFSSAAVTVDNGNADAGLVGYTTLDEGFTVLYPDTWVAMEYITSGGYYNALSEDGSQQIFIYPILEATDLDTTLSTFVDTYGVTLEGEPTPAQVSGYDGLLIRYTMEGEEATFTGQAFVVFKEDTEYGLVFAAETTDGSDPADLYTELEAGLTLFDTTAIQEARLGEWDWDIYTEETYYPIPRAWLPGEESDFGWTYTVPDVEGAFIAMAVIESDSASDLLAELVAEVAETQPGYEALANDIYYGENHTWEYHEYSTESAFGEINVTVENGVAYVVWYETPQDREDLFTDFFYPIVDGYLITPLE